MVITPPSGAQLHNVAVPSVLFDGWWSVECHVSQSSMTQLAQEPKNPVAGYGNDALEYLPPCSHTHADMLREGTPPEVCGRRDSKRVADTCGNHHGRALPLHHALNGSSNLWCVTTATDSKTPGSNCVARHVLWASVLWCTRTCFLGHLRVSSVFLLDGALLRCGFTLTCPRPVCAFLATCPCFVRLCK